LGESKDGKGPMDSLFHDRGAERKKGRAARAQPLKPVMDRDTIIALRQQKAMVRHTREAGKRARALAKHMAAEDMLGESEAQKRRRTRKVAAPLKPKVPAWMQKAMDRQKRLLSSMESRTEEAVQVDESPASKSDQDQQGQQAFLQRFGLKKSKAKRVKMTQRLSKGKSAFDADLRKAEGKRDDADSDMTWSLGEARSSEPAPKAKTAVKKVVKKIVKKVVKTNKADDFHDFVASAKSAIGSLGTAKSQNDVFRTTNHKLALEVKSKKAADAVDTGSTVVDPTGEALSQSVPSNSELGEIAFDFEQDDATEDDGKEEVAADHEPTNTDKAHALLKRMSAMFSSYGQ